ncbi:PP2C family protein-serine/threonine phosphatase [Streptomyces sp. NRRL B-24484]|uniref:PP2C family protein-serine/threonine phosphatase n=1 Tax=Streptomyces sp. NRRL B-24484 TaxID=1463833 RepID=UPI0007C521F8|nr:PP2C family serine/threonine-protein phosphatase [Streptomyces sp. NRRL B-24484]
MPQQQTVCPSCAEPLGPDDAYCGACGHSTAEPAAPAGARVVTDVRGPGATVPDLQPAGPAAGTCAHCGAAGLAADGYCESCGKAQPKPRDHQERAMAGVAGVSDRGLRHHRNEDAFTVAGTSLPGGRPAVVAVVCDGVSSSARPDEASATAVDAASESLLSSLERGVDPTAAMRRAIADAARAVTELAYDDKSRARPDGGLNAPACTYVSAVAADGLVTIGWVGDTRAYWIPDDRESAEPYRLTEDDSWAARMVAAGLMGEAEAYADPRAHAITGWLGADAEELLPHTVAFTPHVPGVVLICTDGLWNYAEAATDLAFFVRADARTEPLAAARSLVDFAVTAGGHDNITVAVLPITPGEAEHEPTLLDLPVQRPAAEAAPAPQGHDATLADGPHPAPPAPSAPPAPPTPPMPPFPPAPAPRD